MRKKVCLITLGCKVNKYETDCIKRMLNDLKFDVSETLCDAEYYVLNTCAVTNEAEKKSRQYIAKINKLNSTAKIIVCGCGAERNREKYLEKQNVVAVFTNQRKDLIVDFIMGKKVVDDQILCFNNTLTNPKTEQARAYIKIQDGCNRFCSYCIIPYLRGRSVSRDINSIINEAHCLAKSFSEIVLVGIDMSDYKVDGQNALAMLMDKLKDVPARIRMGSLEVSVVTDDFMKILKSMPNFAPQFHLSLQSGDDSILKKMNRKYTRDEYIEAVNKIYSYFPNANITTDIIVGFPYETEENFANTLDLAQKVKFGKIHCFPFSAKKGTLAATYKNIDASIKNERMNRLESLASKLQDEYNTKYVGQELNVLIEEIEDDYYTGYSENYIKCYFKSDKEYPIGQILKVTGVKLLKEGLEVVVC